MIKKRGLLLMVFVVSLVVGNCHTAFAAGSNPIGTVSAIEGRVLVLHSGEYKWEVLKLKDKAYLHDQVRTKQNSKVEILFDDDSLITLAANSSLEIEEHIYNPDKNFRKSAFKLFAGKLRGLLARAFSSEISNFRVNTPTAVIGVRGTEFVASVVSQELTEVYCLKNEVKIKNLDSRVPGEINLIAGFASRIKAGTPPARPTVIDPAMLQQLKIDTRVLRSRLSISEKIMPATKKTSLPPLKEKLLPFRSHTPPKITKPRKNPPELPPIPQDPGERPEVKPELPAPPPPPK